MHIFQAVDPIRAAMRRGNRERKGDAGRHGALPKGTVSDFSIGTYRAHSMDAVPTSAPVATPAPQCVNHPHVATAERCARCVRSYCGDCLVPILGQSFCAACKAVSVRNLQRKVAVPDRQAHGALMYSVVGVLLCAFLHPVAIARAVQALKRHKGDPTWTDRWKAVTAVVISSIMLVINIGYLLVVLIYGAMGR